MVLIPMDVEWNTYLSFFFLIRSLVDSKQNYNLWIESEMSWNSFEAVGIYSRWRLSCESVGFKDSKKKKLI